MKALVSHMLLPLENGLTGQPKISEHCKKVSFAVMYVRYYKL